MERTKSTLFRGVLWLQGGIHVPHYTALIQGPMLSPEPNDPAFFSTFASLYPGENEYIVFTDDSGMPQSPADDELREIIAALSPLERQLHDQQQAAALYLPDATADEQWSAACVEANRIGLPIAMLLFGERVADGQRVGYLGCHAVAPLPRVIDVLKSASLRHI